ncbi:MAG TPA: sensor histidine kinase N-terminal domain-containing protein [Burkholderiales bacterium]|nr:sensor histidine kinase N-terminal domain-containing protein [Burkholderiales bacterium]
MRPDHPTLRRQLLYWLLVPLCLVLAVDVIGSYVAVRAIVRGIYDGELAEIARELVLHVRAEGGQAAFDLSSDAERTLLLDEYDQVYYSVHGASGRVIAGRADLPFFPPAGAALGFADASYAGAPVRIAVLARAVGERPVVIEVAETTVKRTLLARKLLLGVALPQVGLILLAALLLWLGVARGLAPLEQLRRAVAARSHLDMSALEARGIPAEVHPLIVAINDLMRRLAGVLEFQARFIADTAHQLRTPVAGLKAHIEVALREKTLPQTRAALAHLYTSAERLSRLVGQLLSLARNEPHSARTEGFAPLDFNKLTLDTTAEWVAQAYAKKIDLGFDGAESDVMVWGDATRLTELINNLVDNAIRYTPPGGRVTVHVRAEPHPQLVVSDDGPRIPVEERQRVFERFHRLLGTGSEGSGLGLAIVRDIAALHQARIDLLEDADGVGNTFIVSFPACDVAMRGEAETLQDGNPAASHM